MIINIYLLISTSCVAAVLSSEFSLKGDPCSKFDSCHSKEEAIRTCSCDTDCQVYGTCCHDFQKVDAPVDTFLCYHDRSITPVFAKRSCMEDYPGHDGDLSGCLDDEADEMDVKNNLLVTSLKTKITYWNKLCAACNKEEKNELWFWNMEVFCPAHKDVTRNLIRRNITFDKDIGQWGLRTGDEFLTCIIKYAPPPHVDEIKRCNPNLISSCPADYSDKEIALKCSQYYAERKLKNSEMYYKNVHCAICNSINVKDLECPGILTPEDDGEETDFQEMVVERIFRNEWISGKVFNCSRGYSHDPFKDMCWKYEHKNYTVTVWNSSDRPQTEKYLAIIAILLFALFH